ncbi:GPR1/FUN34/yaaH family-domain-containing protein [Stachybotrys elegans]|uniref:GPR1/FUN34/yaaH family-domain-containing protein n=1 Tax=Stachybotrys elegans TaxID=80388 RepID=A0A8K0T172_9HYPO|nr:GPR1/FUN34/yaaH family-domain-containing protein [Stachybotrys elegans]
MSSHNGTLHQDTAFHSDKPMDQHIDGQQYGNGHHYTDSGQYLNGYRHADGTPVAHKPHQATISQVYNPQINKLGNPGPLGLMSFAITTFVLGLYQCGAGLPDSNPLNGRVGPDQSVFGMAVFVGGLAQFVAGLLEFRVGNTFGSTVHCIYGGFWLSFAMFLVPSLGISDAYAGDTRAYSFSVGIYLLGWCFLTLIFFIGALKTNITILLVFGFLALAFFFLSIAQFISTEHFVAAYRVNRAGGVAAVIDSLLAFYAGAAGLMTEDTTWVKIPLGEIHVKDSRETISNTNPA